MSLLPNRDLKEVVEAQTHARMKRILFIINPVSGRRHLKNISGLIHKTIDRSKFDVSIQYTESKGHGQALSSEAVEANTDIIVAVGGDGTINEVAAPMIGSASILGIIPLGSGNGLARHLGISRSVRKAIGLINQMHHIAIDTAIINDRSFVSIAGVGFDAAVAHLFAKNDKRGFFSYLGIIRERFRNYQPQNYELVVDGEIQLKTDAFFISFANSNQFGYNTAIAPDASLTDGILNLCIVKKPDLWEMPIIAGLLFLKKIDRSKYVQILPARTIKLTQQHEQYVNLDGEAILMNTELNIKVMPKSLHIITPQHANR